MGAIVQWRGSPLSQPRSARERNVDVDAVGLGAPAAPLDRKAGRVHDVDLDPALAERTRDPEAVRAGLVAHHHPPHLVAGPARFILPLLDRPERAGGVPGLELAQRTTRHARRARACPPRPAAQFQNDH